MLPVLENGAHWEPVSVLSDEFNGDRLDPNKWRPSHPSWSGREPSRFYRNNVSVKDGRLLLKSTPLVKDIAQVADPNKDIWVAAACVSSLGRSAGYGYYEARVKASKLSMTSSFWFQGRKSEIDVVEQVGRSKKNPKKSRLMMMNTHSFGQGWKKDISTPRQWEMSGDVADEWHVYGVWWKGADEVEFYHNGKKVMAVKPGDKMTEKMYMYFDTEVFIWEGLPEIEALNDPNRNTMAVDWVRAWREVRE